MTQTVSSNSVKSDELGYWADTIYRQKYAQEGESWTDTARRVVENVLKPYFPELVEETIQAIRDRKFLPGGRYLYAAGKKFNQTNNCLLLKVEDTREDWGDLMNRATVGLMTGAGIGVVYSALREEGALIVKTGGTSTGPLALMQMINEAGRYIMQGGSRRSAIWAGLHWWHSDIFKFITMKNWSDDVRALKEKDFNFPARMDMTNISVILDDEFFKAFENPSDIMHDHAQKVYWQVVEQMLTTGEPGFSIDVGVNAGENLRNAPVSGNTHILTKNGYLPVNLIVGTPTTIWTGHQWAQNVIFKETDSQAKVIKVKMTGGREIVCDPTHPFIVNGRRVAAKDLVVGQSLDVSLPVEIQDEFSSSEYTLGWIYGDGSFSGRRAELTLCSEESKACLPWLVGYSAINENDSRGYTRIYFGSDDKLLHRKKDFYKDVVTPSFVAGLFDADGNWEPTQKRIRLASKHNEFLHDIRRGLETLGICANVTKAGHSTYGKSQMYQLVIAADSMTRFAAIIPTKRIIPSFDNYKPYRKSKIKVLSIEDAGVEAVYCADVQKPEHSFVAEGVLVSNCTEITSSDDNDICNLGSINLARVETKEEFARLVEIGTTFLLAGTLYSKLPYDEVEKTRTKNRRLGLGLMGVYEWLLVRGYNYGPNDELGEWLNEYQRSDEFAKRGAERLGVSVPVKTRALAPNGTIGIIGETTTSLEPLLAAAIKRRYLKGQTWHFQYVVDASAKRLLDRGVAPELLEDAYDLANDPERRISFQAWFQNYVDHGISSTINLPPREGQNFTVEQFGNTLYKYLPQLRGITVYPDGSRGGQPITKVALQEALDWEGYEYEESGNSQACVQGACGV